MKNIAIIPARSGSKGLKDKNIKLLGNKPLIAYSIEAAIKSECFDEVMVSTDSEEYAKIAREYGAKVPFLRSAETSSDQASSWDAVKEVLKLYKEKFGQKFDVVTLLQPTSPLRNAQDICDCVTFYKEKEARAVISVCEMEHSPYWCNVLGEDLSMEKFAETDNPNVNRQSLQTFYRQNGAIYMLDVKVLEHIEKIYDERCYAFVMKQKKSIDIDSEIDFEIAELLFNKNGSE